MILPIWSLWMIGGVILLILEIVTPGFVISLIGLSCIITGIVAIFTDNLTVHFIVFSLIAVLLMIFIRPLFLKYLTNPNKRKSNADALIGKAVLVDSTIDNTAGKGYIKIGADYIKARSEDGNIIERGETVVIKSLEGITATVALRRTNTDKEKTV